MGWTASNAAGEWQIRKEDGEISNGPPDDELILLATRGDFVNRLCCPALDSDWGDSNGKPRANPATLEREGSTPDAPFSRRQKVSTEGEKRQGGREFIGRHCFDLSNFGTLLTIGGRDVSHARRHRLLGLPTNLASCPMGKLGDFLQDSMPHSSFLRDPSATNGWIREDHPEPLSLALQPAGAVKCEAYDFRIPGGARQLTCPLGGRDFQVWTAPESPIQKFGIRVWRLGARLGNAADGL